MKKGEERLRHTLRRLHQPPSAVPPLDLQPTSPYELYLGEQLKALRADVDKLTTRLNWLVTVIVGAAVTNVILALLE